MPEVGRWVNRDPIRESGGIGLYGYAETNPISKSDLLGLISDNSWHHLLPQAPFREYGLDAVVDIDDKKYGWILPVEEHKLVHRNRWNAAWEQWILRMRATHGDDGITSSMIDERLKQMMRLPEFRAPLAQGAPAPTSYGSWKKFSCELKNAVLQSGPDGGKILNKCKAVARGAFGKGVLAFAMVQAFNTAQAEGLDAAVSEFVGADMFSDLSSVTGDLPALLDTATSLPTVETVSGGWGGWDPRIGYIPAVPH